MAIYGGLGAASGPGSCRRSKTTSHSLPLTRCARPVGVGHCRRRQQVRLSTIPACPKTTGLLYWTGGESLWLPHFLDISAHRAPNHVAGVFRNAPNTAHYQCMVAGTFGDHLTASLLPAGCANLLSASGLTSGPPSRALDHADGSYHGHETVVTANERFDLVARLPLPAFPGGRGAA